MSFNIDNYISNLAYINKDFNSTWEEILETVPKLTDKWVPSEANESDPLVVLLKELGIVTDKLNYNIDKNVLETFPDLLTQLRAAYSVFSSMGYVPQWYRSALLNVNIIYSGGAGSTGSSSLTEGTGSKFNLKKFTEVCDTNTNIVYTLLKDTTFTLGTPVQESVLAMEGTINDLTVNGNTLIDANYLDSQNRLYFLQPNIAQNGIFISEDEDFSKVNIEDTNYDSEDTTYNGFNESGTWQRVTNIYQHLPGSKVFQFGIDPSTGSAYIQFPEDIGSLIQNGLYIKYILSSGESGNIKARTLSKFVNAPSLSIKDTDYTVTDENFTVNNAYATQNGKDPETIKEMQANYQRVVGTFNTLVTLKDYENYLYNEEDEFGRPIVSNIKVSDRTCDLYSSYKVKTLTTEAEIKTITTQTKDDLTAYELRLYPLKPVNSVVDYTTFKNTFEYVNDDSPVITAEDTTEKKLDRKFTSGLEDAVSQAKTVLHDFKKPSGTPIFLDYELVGEIYLHKSLSKAEAAEVRNNVVQAIYKNFNARELTFGKEIDYSEMVDIIKASDPRIQYVALRPIEYTVSDPTLQLFNSRNGGLDITSRSILKGSTPWTQYEDMLVYWGSNPGQSIGSSSITECSDSNISGLYTTPVSNELFIKSIRPYVDIEGSIPSYTVGKNETLSIITPGYKTKTTYTNYCYMVWRSKNTEVKADTPYKLDEGEFIRIYERRPEKVTQDDYLLVTLGSGTMVSCNTSFNVVFDKNEITGESENIGYIVDSTGKNIINMSTSIAVSVIEPDIENINSVLTDKAAYAKGIKVATNSQGLCEMLGEVVDLKDDEQYTPLKYTLNIGEYLLWTNDTDVVLEVGTVGEGNTIIKTQNVELNVPLLTGDADLNKIVFAHCNNDILQYRANTISSFGEGYTLQVDGTSSLISKDSYKSNSVFELVDVTKIQYKNSDAEEWQTLPGKDESETYQASLCLALAAGGSTVQTLYNNQKIEISLARLKFDEKGVVINPYEFAEFKKGVTKEKALSITLDSSKKSEKSNIYILQSTSTILYPGGPALQLLPAESVGCVVKTLDLPASSLSTQAGFINVSSTTTIPSGGGFYIFPAIITENDKKVVRYYIFQSDSDNTISLDAIEELKGAQVGQIKKLVEKAEIYKRDATSGTFSFISASSLFPEESSNHIKLTTDLVYNLDYDPLYEPSDSELIKDPSTPASFFKDSHVCNKYVLPRLYVEENRVEQDPLRKLVISTLSIRE